MNPVTPAGRLRLPLPLFGVGKVRETYRLDPDRLLVVASDRISAFDWVLPSLIPDKGRLLTQLSAHWFRLSAEIQPNHLISTDRADLPASLRDFEEALDGRFMIVRRADRIDFECVVRGYLAGSAWNEYLTTGAVTGIRLPAGLRRGERLPEPIFTPATKAPAGAEGEPAPHDVNVRFEVLVEALGAGLALHLRRASLALYRFAAAEAERRGLILADTKFEFGMVGDRLILIDELLTPDSSRYWDAAAYRVGEPPESFDKQPVRDWLSGCGWDRTSPPPALPAEVIEGTRRRYLEAFARLTGRPLEGTS